MSYLSGYLRLILMNQIINVLIAVNTASLNPNQPQVYLMSDHSGDQKEGSSELDIVAKVGDYIHWRAVAINLQDDVELINFENESGGTCVEQPYMTSLGWTTKVVGQGSETYTFTFSVNGKGIFTWDPRIDVVP